MNLDERKTGQQRPVHGGHHFSTRGWVTPSLVGILCLGLLTASYERGHGNFHKLKTRVNPPLPQVIVPPGPGGQDAIHLSRSATSIGKGAEFISAVFLPGRGMNVFQLTALIPGHGEVQLLASPALTSATSILNGQDEDANGEASMSLGGAILVPWAQSLSGEPTGTPGMLQANWDGRHLTFPAMDSRSNMSVEGLLLNQGTDNVKSAVLPDGQSALAVFHPGDFSGNWPSTIDVKVQAELTAHDLDLTVTATNTGQQPAPFGVGWHPLFAIPSGDRSDAILKIPSQNVMEVDHRTGLPTGKIGTTDDSIDFSRAGGTKLGMDSLNETYTDLKPGTGSGPVAEISDPAYNFKLSVIPLTANITNMHVVSPSDKPWVSIDPNTNLDDPFGSEWGNPANAGIVTLAPGATLRWKVRVEISLVGVPSSTQ